MSDLNQWEVETDPKTIRRLGKTIEEMGELIAVLGRCLIQGVDEVDPSSKEVNRERLRDEMADVFAQLDCTKDAILGVTERKNMHVRRSIKRELMGEWEAMYSTDKNAR